MANTFKRKLTPFLAQEMLYDFAVGRLDGDRKAAVEEFLKKDKECQQILEAIQRGLKYAESLQKVELKPEVLTALKESENAISLGRRYSSWREWPESLRWSVTALILTSALAAVISVIPWGQMPWLNKKTSTTVEIAQLTRSQNEMAEAPPDAPIEMADVPETSGDEESGDEMIDAHAPPPPQAVAVKPTPTPAPQPAAKPGPSPAAPPAQQASSVAASDSGEQPEPTARPESKAKGFVYRATMNLPDLDDIGPKITENIVELGGEKAGEVELGWKRGTGRYYHFALPADNEEKLLEKLRAYGPVRISKDPHPRVMPEGQIRFILWVDAAT